MRRAGRPAEPGVSNVFGNLVDRVGTPAKQMRNLADMLRKPQLSIDHFTNQRIRRYKSHIPAEHKINV
jgi:hypothetical protein